MKDKEWIMMTGMIYELRSKARKAVNEVWILRKAKFNEDLPDEVRELKNYLDAADAKEKAGTLWPQG